jgi:hypothetical protein
MPEDPRASFFPKRRVRVELSDWKPKHNSEDEKRIRLDFMLPLIDENREGMMPSWAMEPLLSMEREDSKQTDAGLDVTLESVTVELFDTSKSPGRSMLLASATLQGFVIKRITRDKQTFPALLFNCNVKRDWNLLRWADKYECCYLWSEFTPTGPEKASVPAPGVQMTIGDAGASNPETEHDEDEAEPTGESHESQLEALYPDAVKVVREEGKASTSLLQRRFGTGYGLAARLLDKMEANGVVGAADGPKPREVLPIVEEQSAEEAEANAKAFFQSPEAKAEVDGVPVPQMAAELNAATPIDEKPRRPRGFGKTTQQGVQ